MSDEIAAAVAAVEGEPVTTEPEAVDPDPAAVVEPPAPDPKYAKRMAEMARKAAALHAREEQLKQREASTAERLTKAERYEQALATAKNDPLAFLESELGVEFPDLARRVIARGAPKDPDPMDEARAAQKRVEDLEKRIADKDAREEQMRQQHGAREAIRAVHDEVRGKVGSEFKAIGAVLADPELTAEIAPLDQVTNTMVHVWQHGAEIEIDGKVMRFPKGTELDVDLAAKIVDNGIMRLLTRFGEASGRIQKANPPAEQPSETHKSGSEGAKKPRTLSNSRATTPTSPVRERRYASEEEEIADLASRYNVYSG